MTRIIKHRFFFFFLFLFLLWLLFLFLLFVLLVFVLLVLLHSIISINIISIISIISIIRPVLCCAVLLGATARPHPSNHIQYIWIGFTKCKHSITKYTTLSLFTAIWINTQLFNLISGGRVALCCAALCYAARHDVLWSMYGMLWYDMTCYGRALCGLNFFREREGLSCAQAQAVATAAGATGPPVVAQRSSVQLYTNSVMKGGSFVSKGQMIGASV